MAIKPCGAAGGRSAAVGVALTSLEKPLLFHAQSYFSIEKNKKFNSSTLFSNGVYRSGLF
jgi:predicted component of type VI protein secretion system